MTVRSTVCDCRVSLPGQTVFLAVKICIITHVGGFFLCALFVKYLWSFHNQLKNMYFSSETCLQQDDGLTWTSILPSGDCTNMLHTQHYCVILPPEEDLPLSCLPAGIVSSCVLCHWTSTDRPWANQSCRSGPAWQQQWFGFSSPGPPPTTGIGLRREETNLQLLHRGQKQRVDYNNGYTRLV